LDLENVMDDMAADAEETDSKIIMIVEIDRFLRILN